MPKKRVYEVAKALNKANNDIISALQKKGVEVKSHMSTLSDEHVSWLSEHFKKKRPEKSEAVKNMMRKKEEKEQKETRTPREERNNKENRSQRENREGARQRGGSG